MKEQYLDRYASVFAAAGFVVLVYDHANFGASDGVPRQGVDPVLQKRGYRDAISYAQTVPFVDAARIGILAFDGASPVYCQSQNLEDARPG